MCKDNHMEQMKKQLREATAAMFFLGLKSQALVFRRQSILGRLGILELSMGLGMVAFLQLSSYCVWELLSRSSMWKELLQLPVTMVLPSLEQERPNLSKMASFSNISHSFPFTPSWIITLCTGFLLLHTSHTFTVRQSRVAMYFPLLTNSPLEQDAIMSVMKFFCWLPTSLLKLMALSAKLEILRSASLSVPLLVPQMKRLSDVGCSLEKVIFSLTSSILSLPRRSTATQGLWGLSSPQRQACTSSLESMYCSLLVVEMELTLERCLLGRVCTSCELMADSTACSLGMLSSLPADLTTFFSVFSQIFQSLMLLLLQVSIFMYLPWGRSQVMPVISSSTSMLLSGSNSLAWD